MLSGEEKLGGKQKRFLRAMATGIDPVFQIGKAGLTENVIVQIDTALEARELVKLRVLDNSGESVKDIARQAAEESGAELVQVIGHNFVLFRPSKKKPRIQLP